MKVRFISAFTALLCHAGIAHGATEPFDRWRTAPRIQARIKELGFSSERQLHSYFMQRLTTLASERERRIVGWDYMSEGSPVVLSSSGLDGALSAVAAGHDVVVSSFGTLDLNHRQSAASDEIPGLDETVRLEDVYAFDPAPTALSVEDRQQLIGVQANVWTDFSRTESDTEAIAFPRGAALAEIAWSPANQQSWAGFLNRLVGQMHRFDKLGIIYSDAVFRVAIIPRGADANRVGIELSRQAASGVIRYTLNGTEPTARSPVYKDIIDVKPPATIKAASFLDDIALSSTVTLHMRDAALAAAGKSN